MSFLRMRLTESVNPLSGYEYRYSLTSFADKPVRFYALKIKTKTGSLTIAITERERLKLIDYGISGERFPQKGVSPAQTLLDVRARTNYVQIHGLQNHYALFAALELLNIARILECEIADLLKLGLVKKDDALELGCVPIGKIIRLNSDIRQDIKDYMASETGNKPETLFANVDSEGNALLYIDDHGQPVNLNLSSFYSPDYALIAAGITFLSKTRVSVVCVKFYTFTTSLVVQKSVQIDIIKGKPSSTDEKTPTPFALSKKISLWILRKGPLEVAVIERKISERKKSPQISLASCEGVTYKLRDIRDIAERYSAVNICFTEEIHREEMNHVAKLYPPETDPLEHPENPLAIFILPNGDRNDRGIRIYEP